MKKTIQNFLNNATARLALVVLITLFVALNTFLARDNGTDSRKVSVTMIKPNGEDVTDVNQIVITFSRKMVPLGDMEKSARNLPVSVTPEPGCKWRWANTTTLICWLDKPLPLSTSYEIKVSEKLKSYDGLQLDRDYSASFSTTRFEKLNSYTEFKGPEMPELTLYFNQEANLNSLKDKSSFGCDGFLSKSGIKAEVSAVKPEEQKRNIKKSWAYRFKPVTELEPDSNCRLDIEAGVEVSAGPLTSKQKITSTVKTYPEFYLEEIKCYPEKKSGSPDDSSLGISDCNPDSSFILKFSVPILNEDFAGRIRVEPHAGWQKGGYNSPEYLQENPTGRFRYFRLQSPFDGRASYKIDIADGVVDIFGRSLRGARQITFTTGDFKPHFSLSSNLAIMERDGPHQLAYTVTNISKYRLRLLGITKGSDLSYYNLIRDYSKRCKEKFDPFYRYREMELKLDSPLNAPETLPLDFKRLFKDEKYGLVLGAIDQIYDHDSNRIDLDSDGDPSCPKYFSALITDLGITSKLGYFNGGVWVHSIKSGAPLHNVQIELINEDGKQLFSGKSDKNGFVELPGLVKLDPERKAGRWRGDKWFVVARHKDDFSFVDPFNWSDGISSYNFNVYTNRNTKKNNFLLEAISDRPLYKAGDRVRVKLFARQWDHKSLKLLNPDERQLHVEIKNSMGDLVLEKTVVNLNEFSTGNLSFQLPHSAALGDYHIHVYNSHDYHLAEYDLFRVDEYRLPPFKVELAADRERYDATEVIPLQGRVSYHFGGGVQFASGELTGSFMPGSFRSNNPSYDKYIFDSNDQSLPGSPGGYSRTLFTYELKTDRQGVFSNPITLPATKISSYGTLTMESSFRDDSGKNIANRTGVKIHPTDFYLGLATSDWIFEPGEDFKTNVIALTSTEKLRVGVKVKLTLKRRVYNTVRRRGAGSYYHYDTNIEDKTVKSCNVVTTLKPVSCVLKPKAAGYYIIEAEARDKKDRLVKSSIGRYVTGSEYIGWYRQDHDRIDLIPEKKEYNLGEKLRVLVKSPYQKARAVVTIERHGILERKIINLRGGSETIEFPLNRRYFAPGFYLSVIILQGRTSEKLKDGVDLGKPSFKMGLVPIRVVNPDTTLKVTTESIAKKYKPGELVAGRVKVTNIRGKGVLSEVAVAVVDEALLQLTANYREKYNVHDYFYRMPGLDVATAESLIHLIGRRHYGKKGATPGGGGGLDGVALREAFKSVAYWQPDLKTDKKGELIFRFKAPDNLTTWRIIAVAVDKNHRFGTGSDGNFKVNKMLMVESALPNFLTEGDELNARFVVHNRTKKERKVDVKLKTPDLKPAESKPLKVKVEKSGKKIVEFPVKALVANPGAKVEIAALAGDDSDGMRLKLPIQPLMALSTFSTSGSTLEKNIKEDVEIPSEIRTDVGGIDLLLSSSIISGVDDVFRYVFDYPYECWEQKLTRALMYRNNLGLKNYLGPESQVKSNTGEAKIDEVLERAPLYQAPNGGFAYWRPESRLVDPYLSAYTGLGFFWLKGSGYKISSGTEDKLYNFLEKLLKSDSYWPWYYSEKTRAIIRSIIVYTLAARGENVASQVNKLYGEKDRLDLLGKAFLLRASQQKGGGASDSIRKDLVKEIMNHSEITSNRVQFSEEMDSYNGRILSSSMRTNCVILSALVESDQDSTLIMPLMNTINTGRKANRWKNTQENLYCLNAMIDYSKVFENEAPDFKVTGKFGDTDLGKLEFNRLASKPEVLSYRFKPADLGQPSLLKIKKSGPGRIYYTARLRFAYKKLPNTSQNSGMQVERTYYILDNREWKPVKGEVKINRGDLVRTRLLVKAPRERLYVALDDPLPAGLEPVNTDLAAASQSAASLADGGSATRSYVWNGDEYWEDAFRSGGFYHRELGLKSVRYFADYLPMGSYELNYVSQAIATGKFTANAALVEEMYTPETYGRGTATSFIISEP